MTTDSGNPEILDREQCMHLLGKVSFGRILYTSGALPVIQPVNYVLDGETIVVRTDGLTRLADSGRQEVVAFEIDDIDPVHGSGWSVLVTGHATQITSEAELAHARTLSLPVWVLEDPGRYIRIDCELVTGQCLRRGRPVSDQDTDRPPAPDDERAG